QGGIREARGELAMAEQAVRRTELNLQQRLASVYQLYTTAYNQTTMYAAPDGLLETSQRALELVRRGYQAGELDYLDFLTAQRTYSQVNLTYLEALRDLRTAEIELQGWLLKGSLEVPPKEF